MAVDKKKVCSKSFPYIILIVALVLGLIALVLIPLIIWKLATWYKVSCLPVGTPVSIYVVVYSINFVLDRTHWSINAFKQNVLKLNGAR
jgi:hypothetical protein